MRGDRHGADAPDRTWLMWAWLKKALGLAWKGAKTVGPDIAIAVIAAKTKKKDQ